MVISAMPYYCTASGELPDVQGVSLDSFLAPLATMASRGGPETACVVLAAFTTAANQVWCGMGGGGAGHMARALARCGAGWGGAGHMAGPVSSGCQAAGSDLHQGSNLYRQGSKPLPRRQ